MQGDFLKIITRKNCIVDLANLHDKKYCMVSQKKMYFDIRALDKKSMRDKSLKSLLKSLAISCLHGVLEFFRQKILMNFAID